MKTVCLQIITEMQISMLNKKNLYKALATLMSVKENGVDCAEYKKRQHKKKN